MTDKDQNSSDSLEQELEDEQVLIEVALNERIVKHSKLGDILFRMPTLEVQQKIDRVVRARKKALMAEKVEVIDSEGNSHLEPAFKSKKLLEREYDSLGWWGPEQSEDLKLIEENMLASVATLEVMGYESTEALVEQYLVMKVKLHEHFADIELEDSLKDSISNAVEILTNPGQDFTSVEFDLIKNNAVSTDVDDMLTELQNYNVSFTTYMSLVEQQRDYAEAQREYLSLFSDSWQEQLQYYIRLSQLYYCVSDAKTRKPMWKSPYTIEKSEDQEFVTWALTELTAYWQGLTDEARERLGKYSFMVRQNEEKSSTEDALDLTQSNEDGESPENEEMSSSKVTDTPEVSTSTN